MALVEPSFHRYELPEGAVSVALLPSQITRSLLTVPDDSVTVIVVGMGFTTTTADVLVAHKLALVAVTVYDVLVTGLTRTEAVVFPVLQE